MKNKVFLGGTCGESTWRDDLIKNIQLPYFNPVVKDWTPKCQALEEVEKESYCNIHFYYIDSNMEGVYSIAEAVNSSHKKGKVVILHINPEGFEGHVLKSLKAVVNLVQENGGIAYIDKDLLRSARVLNYGFSEY